MAPLVYRIAAARLNDLRLLPAIELAAARLLAGRVPDSVLAETTSDEELQDAHSRGLLWVALADDVPVGFAHVKVLEPTVAHLEEIDVHPEHGRRGLGTRLVMACAREPRAAGTDRSLSQRFGTSRGTCRSTRDSGSR